MTDTITSQLISCIGRAINVEETLLSHSSRLGDFAEWDSLGQIKIYFAIQEEFGVEMPLELLANVRSIKDWSSVLVRNLAAVNKIEESEQ